MAHSKNPEHDFNQFPCLEEIEQIVRSLVPPSELVIGFTTIKTHEKITEETAHFCGGWGEKRQIKTLRAVNRRHGTYLNLSFAYNRTYHYAIGFWDAKTKKNLCIAHGSTKDFRYALSQYLAFKG